MTWRTSWERWGLQAWRSPGGPGQFWSRNGMLAGGAGCKLGETDDRDSRNRSQSSRSPRAGRSRQATTRRPDAVAPGERPSQERRQAGLRRGGERWRRERRRQGEPKAGLHLGAWASEIQRVANQGEVDKGKGSTSEVDSSARGFREEPERFRYVVELAKQESLVVEVRSKE